MAEDDDRQVLRAAAHPLRLRMLSLLTGTAMSAAEVARELGITHANASYHLRVLARAGEVVEAGEEKVRGGTAKRYRHEWDDRHREAGARPREIGLEVRTMGQELVRRVAERETGRGHSYFCDAELWVDEETWARALALVEEAGRLVHDAAQPPRTAGTRRTNLTVAAFGMTPGGTP
ncbi:ArsR/SmtB family transcription factor [Nocardioides dongkuii]|uniref:ArsR/SmtB family transcription factor n=1 Tax=Nocardioides dongkuii TaxID=2760089 RepID=UPI0015F820CA|nr:helix-turn-helix domain-containing protein [Nocardioides dongkuii]